MRIKFTGYVEIPDIEVDSHCDVDHYLMNLLSSPDWENADHFYAANHLSWTVEDDVSEKSEEIFDE